MLCVGAHSAETASVVCVKSSLALLHFLASQPSQRFTDPEGRVNGLLRNAIAYKGTAGAMSQMLASLEDRGLITRVLHGRRCPVVALTPQGAETLRRAGYDVPDPRDTHESTATTPHPVRPAPHASVADVDLDELARTLLNIVLEKASGPATLDTTPSASRASIEQLLSRINELESALASRTAELEAQRARADVLDANLAALMHTEIPAREFAETRRRLEQALRSHPS